MDIENLINNLKDEDLKQIVPIFVKYCDQLYISDYYFLYKELYNQIHKEK